MLCVESLFAMGLQLLMGSAAPDVMAIASDDTIWAEVQGFYGNERIPKEKASVEIIENVYDLLIGIRCPGSSERAPNLRLLDGFSNLHSLRIYFQCPAPDDTLLVPPSLRELWLFGGGTPDMLSAVPNLPLEVLVARGASLKEVDDIAACQTLRWLDLRENELRDISALAELKNLVSLDVRGNPFSKDSLESFSRLRPDVRVLSGECRKLDGDLTAMFCGLYSYIRNRTNPLYMKKHFQSLKELNLDRYPRPEDDLPDISEPVRYSIKILKPLDDRSYLADFAAPLVYAVLSKMKGGGSKGNDAGAQVSLYSANLYLKAFSELSGLPEGHEEMCSGSVLVNWIIAHRIDLGPSLLLDDLLAEWTSISTHRAE